MRGRIRKVAERFLEESTVVEGEERYFGIKEEATLASGPLTLLVLAATEWVVIDPLNGY